MKRKFVCIGFPYFFGLLAFSIGWGIYNYIIIALMSLWTFITFIFMKSYRKYILVMAFSFFVGLNYSTVYTYSHYHNLIKYDGKEITIKGYVSDYRYTSSDKGIITVKGKINDGTKTQISFFVPDDEFDYYEEIEIKGTVKKIEDGIDFQESQYYRAKGVFLKGSEAASVVRFNKNKNIVFKAIKEYRDYMFSLIKNIVDGQEGSFLAAMLCGDKSGMEIETKTNLYRVGIGHIFSVSGTHLVIISAFFGFLFKYLRLNQIIRFILMEIAVWSFVVFAGLSPSVLRSAIMITVFSISELFRRHTDCLNTLGICCILLTLGNPYAVKDSSFLLSMSGVFALGVVAPRVVGYVRVKGIVGKAIKDLLTMFTLMFAVMPVTLCFFNEVSLVSPFANVILLPLCTMALGVAVVTVITGGVNFIAEPVLNISGVLIKIVLKAADWLNSFRYCYVTISNKSVKAIVVFICIALMLLLLVIKPLGLKVLSFAVALFSVIIVFNVSRINEKDILHIVIIPDKNMNQTIIYKNSKSVILDNNAKGEHNKAIERVVEKYGIKEINAVAINKERYYSTMQYSDFYPKPEKIIGSYQDFECNERYYADSRFRFDEADITMETDRYIIEIDGEIIIIAKSELYLQGSKYLINEIDFPLEIVYRNNSWDVRGLDYGFNKQ